MAPNPLSPAERPLVRPWAGRAAFGFVLLTLAALVVVPVLVQRRVDALRAEIEASEPARTLLTRLQFNLVREMAALNELLLSGDEEYLGTYAAARRTEDGIVAELAPLAAQLGPAVRSRLARAEALADRWHERVADDEIARRGGAGVSGPRIQGERRLFEEVLEATGAVDSAIVAATAESRAEIASTERAGLALTLLLGVLALVAAGVVAMLDARVRRAAEESERRRREAEEALAESARANEARARLMRGVTHDVKNPLGAAKGYAELLAMGIKGPLLPEQAPLVEGIQRSVDGALAIIADLLDVARADSGGLTVTPVAADLASLAREAVEDHRAAAETAGHALAYEPPPGPVRVETDPARVRQVLDNLLSNAVKYTPAPGRIAVRTEVREGEGAPREGVWAAVRVTDTGPGVPPELREAIFDEFTRLDEGSGPKGHGLGLAIARRVARLLGGDLVVEETEGPGATFVLWLRCPGPG